MAELRTENARLRSLLGLDKHSSPDRVEAWEPTLFREEPLAQVDASSPKQAKPALFRSLFVGRDDVYAIRWANATTGASGWSPAVQGGWSRSSRSGVRTYLPLTDEVVAQHLSGDLTAGLYPLLPGDCCQLLACDFDGGTWALDALAYLDACIANGVPAALERSRSGDGAHIWVFFASPVPAASARALGAALLRQAMTARAELDLASYDRFFPAQDFLPKGKGSFGNLIALPLQGGCCQRGTTLFLDPATLAPWPDQWAFLSSLPRLSMRAVDDLVASARPIQAGPAPWRWRPVPAPAHPRPRWSEQNSGLCWRSSGSDCLQRWFRHSSIWRRCTIRRSTKRSGCGCRPGTRHGSSAATRRHWTGWCSPVGCCPKSRTCSTKPEAA